MSHNGYECEKVRKRLETELRTMTIAANEARQREINATQAHKNMAEVVNGMIGAIIMQYGTAPGFFRKQDVPIPDGLPDDALVVRLPIETVRQVNGKIFNLVMPDKARTLIYIPLTEDEKRAIAAAQAAAGNGGSHETPDAPGERKPLIIRPS